MREYYELHPSPSQFAILLIAHAIVGLAAWAYLEPGWETSASVMLAGLLALRESRQFLGQGIVNLDVDGPDSPVAIEQDGQPYIYVKYKVYATRWFAILKLIDKGNNRTVILNPDRFESKQSYQRLRHALRGGGRVNAD